MGMGCLKQGCESTFLGSSATGWKSMSTTQTLVKNLLKHPSTIQTRSQAKQLHAQIIKEKGISSSPFHTSIILSIYSTLNLLHDSLLVFNTLHPSPARTSLAWKSIIRCYTSNGFPRHSLSCFVEMWGSGVCPDHNVFPSVLKSCTLLMDFRLGESVHGCIVRLGLDFDLYTGNALMNMYSKLENFSGRGTWKVYASKVFDEIPERKRFGGCSNEPSNFENLSDGEFEDDGSRVHFDATSKVGESTCDDSNGLIITEFDADIDCNVDTKLTRSDKDGEVGCHSSGTNANYSIRKGNKEVLRKSGVSKVFETMPKRDIVSWNTVISGNAQNGMFQEALGMVRQMGESDLKPDSFTLSSVLPIFAEYVDVAKGKEIHGYAIRHGFDADMFIGSSLIDMYAKCTRVEDSRRVFFLLPELDNISWNSIIAGCVQNGCFDEGLQFFRQMLMAKVKPRHVSFSSIMPACAHLTTLHLGKQLHGFILRGGFDNNKFIASSLVDMYAKCGNIKTARWIFDKMELHDMVSWTAMIMGYASHGHANEAITLFEHMKMKGVRANYVAFVAVLTACSHAGLVDEAWNYFNSMTKDYGITPGLEHYAAMADLLGRAGKLAEAYDFISTMHIGPTGSVWSTLLAACRVHRNVELAEKVAEKIFLIDPDNTGAYVLLSNVYSAVGRWGEVRKLRTSMRDHGMRKAPACSWIEVNNKVHAFMAGDISHPFHDSINAALGFLLEQMEREGYVPNIKEVLHDVE